MVSARDSLMHAFRTGSDPAPGDVCATIATEAELAHYAAGMKQRGAYTAAVAHAVEVRRHQLQKAKGVRGRA